MSKKYRYSLKPIRRNYTYSVDEVAELYDIAPATVFRWIKDEGLKRIPNSRKYFVHSNYLLKFLKKKNGKNKQPCGDGEMFCCKCRKPKSPKPQSIKFNKRPNKTIRVAGKCEVCNTRMQTFVSGKKWSENHSFYPNKNASTKPHSGEHKSLCECDIKKGEQLCLNITP
ncbi:MAG: helix-turn-helix domain-containing protein [Alphaproteobacteria bacterium]